MGGNGAAAIKAKGVGVLAQQRPNLRPRAALGDLTKVSNLGPRGSQQPNEEKMKKPVLGLRRVQQTATLQKENVGEKKEKPVEEVQPKVAPIVEPEVGYSTQQFSQVEDIDLDRDNPQLVSYYAKDIYKYLRHLEVGFLNFDLSQFCNLLAIAALVIQVDPDNS